LTFTYLQIFEETFFRASDSISMGAIFKAKLLRIEVTPLVQITVLDRGERNEGVGSLP